MEQSSLNAATIVEFLKSSEYEDLVKYGDWQKAETLRNILVSLLTTGEKPNAEVTDKKPKSKTNKKSRK